MPPKSKEIFAAGKSAAQGPAAAAVAIGKSNGPPMDKALKLAADQAAPKGKGPPSSMAIVAATSPFVQNSGDSGTNDNNAQDSNTAKTVTAPKPDPKTTTPPPVVNSPTATTAPSVLQTTVAVPPAKTSATHPADTELTLPNILPRVISSNFNLKTTKTAMPTVVSNIAAPPLPSATNSKNSHSVYTPTKVYTYNQNPSNGYVFPAIGVVMISVSVLVTVFLFALYCFGKTKQRKSLSAVQIDELQSIATNCNYLDSNCALPENVYRVSTTSSYATTVPNTDVLSSATTVRMSQATELLGCTSSTPPAYIYRKEKVTNSICTNSLLYQ